MAELIQSITSAVPAEIVIPARLRPVKRAGVESIRASVGQTGVLKDAIGLRKKADGKLHLIYGLHRLTFALEEGWEAIDCKVWRCTDDWARMMEIDDNLAGAELDALDNAIFLAERKAVYEKMHPETKAGVAGGLARQNSATDMMSVAGFATSTAEKFGLSERQIYRMIAAGSALSSDHRAFLRAAPQPVTLADLGVIAKLPPNDRHAVCLALKNGTAPSAAKAHRQMHAQPADNIPAKSDAKLKALSDAFARADMKAKRQFVAEHFAELQDLMFPQSGGEVLPFATGRAAE